MGLSIYTPKIVSADIQWTAFPTLYNGWSYYGSPFPYPSYSRIDGTVFLKGLIKNTAVPGGTTAICVLPVGCRPLGTTGVQYHISTVGNLTLGVIGITALTGEITYKGGDVGWFSLDTISFRAEQ